MQIDITQVVVALAGILATLITIKLIPCIKSHMSAKQWNTLKTISEVAVMAAKSLDLVGEEKKARAVEATQAALGKAGMKIDTDTVADAVQAAYERVIATVEK